MTHRLRLAVGAVLLGALLGAAPPCRCGERDWTVITLDAEGNAGKYAELQIGPGGKLHVVYLRSDTSTLKLITREGGVWGTPQTIDDSGTVTGYCAVAPMPGGDLPVSYRRSSTGELWYAGPQQARPWSTAQITAETDDVGRRLSVVRQGSEDLALSFRNHTDGSLHSSSRNACRLAPARFMRTSLLNIAVSHPSASPMNTPSRKASTSSWRNPSPPIPPAAAASSRLARKRSSRSARATIWSAPSYCT